MMIAPRASLGVLLAFVPALAAAAAAVAEPVAVMPFKNLNSEPSLEWLKAGVAETMISDLRKQGGIQVVERAQIDRAMAEIALQGEKGTEESTAARVGKMVGAKTIVVGSFQKAGKQLRIAARFVNVETGVVADTAKVTGPLEGIFSLQDEIVEKLVGKHPAAQNIAARRPKRKATQKTVRAYQLYAMSLTTASDADKVGLLKESLAADPDFSYAADDLAALEKRMTVYSREADKARLEKEEKTRAALASADNPQDKFMKSTQLLASEMTARRYSALAKDALAIYESDIGEYYGTNPRDMALMYVVLAHQTLKHDDLALKYGEKYLKEFPTGMYFTSIEMQMRTIIDERRKREDGKDEAAKELAKFEAEKEKEKAEAQERKRELHPAVLRNWTLRPCSIYMSAHRFEEAIAACREFVEKYRGDADPTSKELVLTMRMQIARCHADLGEFGKARAEMEKLMADEPKWAAERYLKNQMLAWPTD